MALFEQLTELELCHGKSDFSVFWLGKSPRYFSTLISENGSASFEVLILVKARLHDFVADHSDFDPAGYSAMIAVYYWLASEIDEVQAQLVTE